MNKRMVSSNRELTWRGCRGGCCIICFLLIYLPPSKEEAFPTLSFQVSSWAFSMCSWLLLSWLDPELLFHVRVLTLADTPPKLVDLCSSLSGTKAPLCPVLISSNCSSVEAHAMEGSFSVLLLWSGNCYFGAVFKSLHRTCWERVGLLASTSLITHIRARHNPPHHYSNCLQWLMFAKWHEEGCPNTL